MNDLPPGSESEIEGSFNIRDRVGDSSKFKLLTGALAQRGGSYLEIAALAMIHDEPFSGSA